MEAIIIQLLNTYTGLRANTGFLGCLFVVVVFLQVTDSSLYLILSTNMKVTTTVQSLH